MQYGSYVQYCSHVQYGSYAQYCRHVQYGVMGIRILSCHVGDDILTTTQSMRREEVSRGGYCDHIALCAVRYEIA